MKPAEVAEETPSVEVAEETPSVEVAVAEEVAAEVTAEVVAVCGLAYAWPRPPLEQKLASRPR